MRIAIGCDHRGLDLKQGISKQLSGMQHSYHDFGAYTADSVDYPDIAREVALAVSGGGYDCGILVCGTGIGMSIAANKVRGIRAALCCNVLGAERARQHNNANIMCLSGENEPVLTKEMVAAFLTTQFEGGRHERRVQKIMALEG